MKLLFIHDNRFWRDGEAMYSYGHFAYDLLWRRYLKVFSEIRVGGRIQEKESSQQIRGLSRSDGEHVSFFGLPNLMSMSGLFSMGKAVKTLREEIHKCDFMIARLPSNNGYLACRIAGKLKKPYMIELVGCTWDDLWNYGNMAGKLAAVPSFLLQKHYVRKAPNVLYVSRKFLQRRYPNPFHTIGCPDTVIHQNPVSLLEQRLAFIRKMNERNEIRIGLIASLDVGYKGHDTAIRAISLLTSKYPRLKLCFLGGGRKEPWQALAQSLKVQEHVEFCGSLPGGEPVLQWLDALDIFIMPSLQETLGRALIEAMSRGVPCLGGDGTAVPEQLPDDCIHPQKDFRALANLLDNMLGSPDYMALCAMENFYRSRKYSEEFLAKRRETFWCESMNTK